MYLLSAVKMNKNCETMINIRILLSVLFLLLLLVVAVVINILSIYKLATCQQFTNVL